MLRNILASQRGITVGKSREIKPSASQQSNIGNSIEELSLEELGVSSVQDSTESAIQSDESSPQISPKLVRKPKHNFSLFSNNYAPNQGKREINLALLFKNDQGNTLAYFKLADNNLEENKAFAQRDFNQLALIDNFNLIKAIQVTQNIPLQRCLVEFMAVLEFALELCISPAINYETISSKHYDKLINHLLTVTREWTNLFQDSLTDATKPKQVHKHYQMLREKSNEYKLFLSPIILNQFGLKFAQFNYRKNDIRLHLSSAEMRERLSQPTIMDLLNDTVPLSKKTIAELNTHYFIHKFSYIPRYQLNEMIERMPETLKKALPMNLLEAIEDKQVPIKARKQLLNLCVNLLGRISDEILNQKEIIKCHQLESDITSKTKEINFMGKTLVSYHQLAEKIAKKVGLKKESSGLAELLFKQITFQTKLYEKSNDHTEQLFLVEDRHLGYASQLFISKKWASLILDHPGINSIRTKSSSHQESFDYKHLGDVILSSLTLYHQQMMPEIDTQNFAELSM